MAKILVTAALPYANGPIHLGHMVEYIQTDIWARWQKLQSNDCIFICGDDAHGTPIMLRAQQQGITPKELITKIKLEHEKDFAGFNISFDNYYTTHSKENQELVNSIYEKLCANNDIITKTITQYFDTQKNMFLPDRFIKGTCPRCKTPDQYGDNCEACGATYSPTELIDPVSVISGTKPIQKESEHYFFRLEKYSDMLKAWAASGHLQPAIANKLNEWFSIGLKQWDISRDAPYFGFAIPNAKDKYFYVWLDAPVGYMASFKNLCQRRPELSFDEYWNKTSATELYHFLGKDIIYFHSLFWPAILESSGFRKPTAIFTHGYLTVNGQKMSKSRGTFITAYDYLQNLNPEYLRYYFAAKLNSGIDDIDLNCDDFTLRVNSDLVGKVVNIASRCAGFINKNFSNQLATELDQEILLILAEAATSIAKAYTELEYSTAMRIIMGLADQVNQYIDTKKPWQLMKDISQQKEVQKICTTGLNAFRLLMIYLKPVLPQMAQDAEAFLNITPLNFQHRTQWLVNHTINTFKPLMQRVDKDKAKELIKS
jgi:methionyl-tRNA synthetase